MIYSFSGSDCSVPPSLPLPLSLPLPPKAKELYLRHLTQIQSSAHDEQAVATITTSAVQGNKEGREEKEKMGLYSLPYDVLLNIANYLDWWDIFSLHLTCKTLHFYFTTRPVYRQLATELLRRCRALPLKGFQRLGDLSNEQLIQAVDRGYKYEMAWKRRAPRPVRYGNTRVGGNNYLDGKQRFTGYRAAKDGEDKTRHLCGDGRYRVEGSSTLSHHRDGRTWYPRIRDTVDEVVEVEDVLKERLGREARRNYRTWYKVVRAPPGEEVDWLSTITSSYTLCATKSGKVVCWDVQKDALLAEWSSLTEDHTQEPEPPDPGDKWELWKCRVEFEEKAVYFTMAKVIDPPYDDTRVMSFVLMKLQFFDGPNSEPSPKLPVFSRVTEFKTTGVVMNVFLLDPAVRLLSAFVWIASSNTIGLYVLPDWNSKYYAFVDTGIECGRTSNWSCILFEDNIVIHCEEAEAAHQYFYPIGLLERYTQAMEDGKGPVLTRRIVRPWRSMTKKFIFPILRNVDAGQIATAPVNTIGGIPIVNGPVIPHPAPPAAAQNATTHPHATPNPNPFPYPPWYPESAHFVRQWWPSLPGIPKVSCTVILLANHDPMTHRTRFVLAQHYFRVPLDMQEWMKDERPIGDVPPGGNSGARDNAKAQTLPVRDERATRPISASKVKSKNRIDDTLMNLWYVSTPFEVVRVFDGFDDEDDIPERPRPLVAVDFGHAVWIEYVDPLPEENGDGTTSPDGNGDANNADNADDDPLPFPSFGSDNDPKALRFVTFPSFSDHEANDGSCGPALAENTFEGVVRTLEVPEELDLGAVETINIDQSQGAVILSDRDGNIFILCYE